MDEDFKWSKQDIGGCTMTAEKYVKQITKRIYCDTKQ